MSLYLSKRLELLAHRHRVTPQKTLTFSNVAVSNSNLSTDSFDDLFCRPNLLLSVNRIAMCCAGHWLRRNYETLHFNTVFWGGRLNSPQWAMVSSFVRFRVHTQQRTTVGRTPLDVWSARHRDLFPTTHNTHNLHASVGIHTRNHSRRAAADLRLRLRGHWDSHSVLLLPTV